MPRPPLPPLPQYRCHKVVQAAKIVRTEEDHEIPSVLLFLDVPPPPGWTVVYVRVSHSWCEKHFKNPVNPTDCGYFVIYEDGYTSWSPTAAFESGYTKEFPNG